MGACGKEVEKGPQKAEESLWSFWLSCAGSGSSSRSWPPRCPRVGWGRCEVLRPRRSGYGAEDGTVRVSGSLERA
jgi:hypothetical protein